MIMECIGVNRHRLGVDGVGVTTLIGNSTCNLNCKYCLNKIHSGRGTRAYTPEKLLDKVKIDDLYFITTHGGITFGGGEPLLDLPFIKDFISLVKSRKFNWKINVETALNVPLSTVQDALQYFDSFIIDIKSLDEKVYKDYTGVSNKKLLTNLYYLSEQILFGNLDAERFVIRVPLIDGFTSDCSVHCDKAYLKHLGFTNFDLFRYRILDNKN